MLEKSPLAIELAGRAERSKLLIVRDDVNVDALIEGGIELAFIDKSPGKVDGTQLLQQARVKTNLAHPVQDFAHRLGGALPEHGVDLHDHIIDRLRAVMKRKQHRVAHITSVPIRDAI